VVSSDQPDYAIHTAQEVWQMEPYRNFRLPLVDNNPIAVDALWTDEGLRPNFNNLAFVVQYCQDLEELNSQKEKLAYLPIRGWILITNEHYYLNYYNQFNQLEEEEIEPHTLASILNSSKSHLFTPKALSEFRTGQLSLGDLEEGISERSFSLILRQRQKLDSAFTEAIKTAIDQIPRTKIDFPKNLRYQMEGHTIRVALAFLSARILEDKGFFNSNSLIPTNDPRKLLNKTVSFTNGFFKRASDSISSLEEFLPQQTDKILQSLATYLGNSVTFALVDHRDVGLLYERAIKKLPNHLKGKDWSDLQRHYTPVAIAEKMLELLPLERIRPEERVIFDPAAGSGSLLLAATSRLAQMSDIPEEIQARRQYLANHVAGNDLDEYADLITKLRYLLAQESLGKNVSFPFPDHYTHYDYEQLNKDNLSIKPRVIIANPPFAEDGNTQRAATFIKKALSWLENGSQFAFILPQSFLTNTTHGLSEVRKLLTDNCQIHEVWQLPEGAVGIDAAQDVCIVSGTINDNSVRFPTIARAVLSRAKIENTRDSGFLGNTWIAKLNSDDKSWSSVTTPTMKILVPTVPLGNLFYVFNGVVRNNKYKPVSECLAEIPCKLNWQMKWRDKNRLWANPNRVDQQERWIRYSEEFLHNCRAPNAHLFDQEKLLVGRKVNRSSRQPLAVQLDITGLCPDDAVFCILPVKQTGKYTYRYKPTNKLPDKWNTISPEDQRLWLLGLLSSKLCNELSLSGRSSRQITVSSLCNLLLPAKVDSRIIEITRQIVHRDKQNLPIPEPDELRIQLDKIVEENYGNPHWIEISRTGTPTGLEQWKQERTKSTYIVRGQVLKVSEDNSQIFVYLNGLLDDDEKQWLPILPEMPGWALDGTVFKAELSEDVETFAELKKRPWAIRRFRHTSRPYFTDEELKKELGVE